jgi:hypothetical protein
MVVGRADIGRRGILDGLPPAAELASSAEWLMLRV